MPKYSTMLSNRTVYGLKLIFYLSFLIEITSIYRFGVFGNDMLIIRHGRSRVRHSSEKKFIRWGLHAFDNLTLFDYDYDSMNGTNGSNETFSDTAYGASNTNQTYFGIGGNDGFGYYSTELMNANTNTNKNNLNGNSDTNDNNESKLISTLAPISMAISQYRLPPSAQSLDAPSPITKNNNNKKQQRGKKQIMASIRKTVEEGIVYLRQHATRHSRPTPNVPLHQLQKQSMPNRNDEDPGSSSNFNVDDNDDGNDMDIEAENQFTLDENGASRSEPLSVSKHLISPLNEQQPFNHIRNQPNKSNNKRMKNGKQPKQRKIKRPTQQRKHLQKQRLHLEHQHQYGGKQRGHGNGNGDGDEFMDSNESNEMLSHNERIYFDFDMENDDDDDDDGNVHTKSSQISNANQSIVINNQHNQPLIDSKLDNDTVEKHSTTKMKRKNKNRRETIKTIETNNNNAGNNDGNGVDANHFRTSKILTNKTIPKHLQFVNDMRQQLRAKQHQNAAIAVAAATASANGKAIENQQATIASQTGDNQSTPFKHHQQLNDSSVRSIAKFHTKNTNRNTNHQFELKGGGEDSSGHTQRHNSDVDSNNDNDMANDASNDNDQIASDDVNNDDDTDSDNGDEVDDDDDNDLDRNRLPFGSSFDDEDDKLAAMEGPGFRMEDFDLDELDETSRNNRLNLMKGQDVVTNFLQIVEYQHLLGANCTAGTALNLGEGVVDRYAQDRFRVEAEVAVNRANMLTR